MTKRKRESWTQLRKGVATGALALALLGGAAACGPADDADALDRQVRLDSADPMPAPQPQRAVQAAEDEEEAASRIERMRLLRFNDRADDAGRADLTPLTELLPRSMSFTFEDSDRRDGGTEFSNVVWMFDTEKEVGLRADRLVVWNLDADFVSARLNGEELGRTGKVADRIVIEDAEVFGLAGVMNTLQDGMEQAIGDAMDDEFPEDGKVEISRYDVGIELIVLEDVSLSPYQTQPVSEAALEEMDEEGREFFTDVFPTIQQFATAYGTLAIEAGVVDGVRIDYRAEQDGADTRMAQTIEETSFSGWNGYALNNTVSTGMLMEMRQELPDSDVVLDLGAEMDTGFYRDLDFNGLGDAIARGAMPDYDSRNLYKIGQMGIEGLTYTFGGDEAFSADSITFSMPSSEWLVPTSVIGEYEGVSVKTRDIVANVWSKLEESDDLPEGEERDQILSALRIADQYGLGELDLQGNFGWRYDARSGEATAFYESALDGFFMEQFNLSMILPDRAAVLEALPRRGMPTDEQGEALEQLFQDVTAFDAFRYSVRDQGGLESLAAMSVELAEAFPDSTELAMIRGSSPKAVRSMLGGFAGMGLMQGAEEFPPLRDYAPIISAWFREGGTLVLSADPAEPVDAVAGEEIGELEPAEIAERLGLSVTRMEAGDEE